MNIASTSPFGIFFLPKAGKRGIEGDFPVSQFPPPPFSKGGKFDWEHIDNLFKKENER